MKRRKKNQSSMYVNTHNHAVNCMTDTILTKKYNSLLIFHAIQIHFMFSRLSSKKNFNCFGFVCFFLSNMPFVFLFVMVDIFEINWLIRCLFWAMQCKQLICWNCEIYRRSDIRENDVFAQQQQQQMLWRWFIIQY